MLYAAMLHSVWWALETSSCPLSLRDIYTSSVIWLKKNNKTLLPQIYYMYMKKKNQKELTMHAIKDI